MKKILISLSLSDKYFDPRKVQAAEQESRDRKSRETLVYMTPKQFLELASKRFTQDQEKLSTIRGVIKSNKPLSDVPYLKTEHVRGFDFKVIGHEGRHRSIVLDTVNSSYKMPVRIIDASVRWIEDNLDGQIITIYAQETNARKLSIKLP